MSHNHSLAFVTPVSCGVAAACLSSTSSSSPSSPTACAWTGGRPSFFVTPSPSSSTSLSRTTATGPITRTRRDRSCRFHYNAIKHRLHPRDNDDDDDDDVIDSRSVLFVTRMSATPPPPPADNADKEDGGNDDAYHDIPDSSIDWNKSWADFQASGGQSTAPVGREPLSREERTRRKMVNQMRDVTESLPTRQQLFADWRFWVALILVLSLFTAFVNSTTAPVTTI